MQFLTILAGANFRPREAKDALAYAGANAKLRLEREPTNQWDANAVKVILVETVPDPEDNDASVDIEHHIGYVAKADNQDIATLLDNEYAVAQGLAAPGHTPQVTRCEVIDFANGFLKPTLVIEISTGFELGTVVKGPDLDASGEADPLPREGE